jgi:hypothetical protein
MLLTLSIMVNGSVWAGNQSSETKGLDSNLSHDTKPKYKALTLDRSAKDEIEQEIPQIFVPLVQGGSRQWHSYNIDYIGHLGGTTDAIIVSGDYAYLGEGASLTI